MTNWDNPEYDALDDFRQMKREWLMTQDGKTTVVRSDEQEEYATAYENHAEASQPPHAEQYCNRPNCTSHSVEVIARKLLTKTTGWQDDEHGRNTPARFVDMLHELTTPKPFEFTTFPTDDQDMVIVKQIPFVSVCNHHVIPFVGFAQVGYVPNHKLVGLSKIARLVQSHARSLQVQERLTREIANDLQDRLDCLGVAVVLEAEHMCMTIRGVQSPGTTTVTSKMTGVFMDHTRTAKAEFLQLIGK